MEDTEIAKDAIGSENRLLSSAEVNAGAGNYDAAVYSLEMAAEISLKAVMFAVEVLLPNTHAIGDLVGEAVKESRAVPRGFKERLGGMVGLLNSLLALRPVSGYVFETKLALEELGRRYEQYRDGVRSVVEECEEVVSRVVAGAGD